MSGSCSSSSQPGLSSRTDQNRLYANVGDKSQKVVQHLSECIYVYEVSCGAAEQ